MGFNKKRGGGKGSSRKGNSSKSEDRDALIEKVDMENERFVSYYKAQNIIPEDEWMAFMDAMRTHLPTTFRVAGSRQTAQSLNSLITDTHVPHLSDVIFEGQSIPPPVQIPWYPDGLAWQFNVPKKVLRKSPEFKKFHSFLVFETEVGNISRQEAVSMLPPLFLEVEPHHKAMDMCAAPGSKTAQILEALHAQDTETETSVPTGLLVANDSDNKRTHLLIHQSARLPSPALMVTNLDASIYPAIKIPKPNGTLGQLLFDRILCDVPCSGDGTIRKNLGIWKTWSPGDGNGLHGLQVRILQRAMNLLKANGRIVYSTCSLNPIENEAVIAEALEANPDFQLVDVSSKLPDLKRRPGLNTWRATPDRSATTTYASYDEFMRAPLDDALKAKLTPGHWPPHDVESLNLSRCLRIYPHHQDSGGFFVAVLERTVKLAADSKKRDASESGEIPKPKKVKLSEDEVEESTMSAFVDGNLESLNAVSEVVIEETTEEAVVLKSKRKGKEKGPDGGFKENPYTFLSPEDPILLNCIERLHMTSEFPSSRVLVRNPAGDAVRSLYLANDIVKVIIENNDYSRLRLTAAGTKVFSKQDAGKGADAQFRVLGEGLPVILPYIDPTTIITASMVTLKTLIESYYPLCSTFVEEPFKAAVEARPSGSHVVRFPPAELDGAVLTHELVLPIWKSNVSLTLMIDKKAKSALSLRLYGQDVTTAGRTAPTGRRQKAAASPKDLTPDSPIVVATEAMEVEDGEDENI